MSLTRRMANVLGRPSQRALAFDGWAGAGTAVSPNSWGQISVDDDASRWTASATAYRCIQAVSGNAASLLLEVRGTDDTVVDNHWLTMLWERPNPLLSRRIMAELLWSRLETRGEAFVLVDRGPTGTATPRALWPIWGHTEPVIAGRDMERGRIERDVIGYRVTVDHGQKIGLLPQEVLWLRYPNPNIEFGALPPLESAGHAVEMDAYARAWQLGEFKNGAKPKHVVYLGDLSQSAHTSAVESWKSQVEGHGNAGKSLLLSGPTRTHIDRLTLTPEEMSWLDTRGVSSQEVMLAFGVPKDYLLGGATYENRAASRTTLWSDAIVPKLETVASEMTRQLLAAEPGRRARFDTDTVDALQEGEDAKTKRVTDLAAHDITTLDEARTEMGLEALPGNLGALTLTAYRTAIQANAQAGLLGLVADDRAARTLGVITGGRAPANAPSNPLLLPNGRRLHGPSKTAILAEYARLEPAISRAVSRLAARQEAVAITNAGRLLEGRSRKAQVWLRTVSDALVAYTNGDTDTRTEAETQLRVSTGDIFDDKHWRDETLRDLEPPVGAAWQSGANALGQSLGINFAQFEQLVLDVMAKRVEVLAGQVTDTTRQILEDRIIMDAVANGESIDQIKARIRAVFNDLSSWRATTIARTEVVGGYNGSSYELAQASGVVVERQWLATVDDRTRDNHRDLDGDTVTGFKTRYDNGLLYPGDPTGLPEETINCRCVEIYVTEE